MKRRYLLLCKILRVFLNFNEQLENFSKNYNSMQVIYTTKLLNVPNELSETDYIKLTNRGNFFNRISNIMTSMCVLGFEQNQL